MTLAVIYEALRLRDLVMTLPKLVAEDTMIPYTTWTTPTDSPTASPILPPVLETPSLGLIPISTTLPDG
jgi:hypothetical protein